MRRPVSRRAARLGGLLALTVPTLGGGAGCLPGQAPWALVHHEQRTIDVRDPSQFPPAPLPKIAPPDTVLAPAPQDLPSRELTIDEAIRIGLANSEVVRVLTGVSATSSGLTIYDPAISNTTIDEQSGVFNPVLTLQKSFSELDNPAAVPAPKLPARARIDGARVNTGDFNLNLQQRTVHGGSFNLDVTHNESRFEPGSALLNPQSRGSAAVSYVQPLLQGAGVGPNLAPIVIARINTERSFFQYKDSVQELVRGIIDAYWAVAFARIDVWARDQQVQQGKVAFDRASARQRSGFSNAAEVAQTRLALANFEVSLINSKANLILRENALRNILGLSPSDPLKIQPMTAMTTTRVQPKWDELLRFAEQRRPDIIELKLIIEADEQSLLLARNQARPRLDATSLYRWNGLEGETPVGARIESRPGQFTEWTMGVNFSVPIGLRSARANLRRNELLLTRDHANLKQAIHNMGHELALRVRNLDQRYAQYEQLKVTREAAALNLEQQLAEFRSGRAIFLNVLQAISDWGNSVSNEAQALTQYNTELANLERQTGAILETHGVRFVEERYSSVGPLGPHGPGRSYPASLRPTPNADHYPKATEPAEKALEREKPGVKTNSDPDSELDLDLAPKESAGSTPIPPRELITVGFPG